MPRQKPDTTETDRAMDDVLAWVNKHRPEWVDLITDTLTSTEPNRINAIARAMILVGYHAGREPEPEPKLAPKPKRRVRRGAVVSTDVGIDLAGDEEPKYVTDLRAKVMDLEEDMTDARLDLEGTRLELVEARERGTEMRDQLHEIVAKEEGEDYGSAVEESPLPWDPNQAEPDYGPTGDHGDHVDRDDYVEPGVEAREAGMAREQDATDLDGEDPEDYPGHDPADYPGEESG